MITNAGFMT